MASANVQNHSAQFTQAQELWIAAGRDPSEIGYLVRALAEKALLHAIQPTKEQLAHWKVVHNGEHHLLKHVYQVSGLIVSFECLRRLWHYFTHSPDARRPSTLIDFVRLSPKETKCRYCGSKTGPFHIDHVIPLAKGGEDAIENLSFLCQLCNQQKAVELDPYTSYFEFI